MAARLAKLLAGGGTLDFDSELVYVGDAGATEANRPSTRRGIEWNHRYVPVPWLLVDADLAWTHARFANPTLPASASPTPWTRSPRWASRCAIWALVGSLQWRYLGSGRAGRGQQRAPRSSLTTNLRISHKFSARIELSLDAFNLLNRRLNDIEYYYESQLPGEVAPWRTGTSTRRAPQPAAHAQARLLITRARRPRWCSLGGRRLSKCLLAPSPSISAGSSWTAGPSPAPRRHQGIVAFAGRLAFQRQVQEADLLQRQRLGQREAHALAPGERQPRGQLARPSGAGAPRRCPAGGGRSGRRASRRHGP